METTVHIAHSFYSKWFLDPEEKSYKNEKKMIFKSPVLSFKTINKNKQVVKKHGLPTKWERFRPF